MDSLHPMGQRIWYNYFLKLGVVHLLTSISGPIFSLNLAGQTVIVLNKREIAVDLLGEQTLNGKELETVCS